MQKSKHLLLTLIASASIGTHAIAEEQQTLELDTADVTVLQLATVKNQAARNSSEIHQEGTVGRAGLQGSCGGPPPAPPEMFE